MFDMTAQKNYRELQAELDTITDKMQSQDSDIEESLQLYKQAQSIIKQLEDYLKTAQNEIEHLKKS